MHRTALVLALGFTLTAVACGGSDDTSTDVTGANGAGASGTAGAAGGAAGAAGAGGAGTGGTGGTAGATAGTGGTTAGTGGTAAGNGGSAGSVGGKGGSGGALACPTAPSQGASCTQSCSYPTTLCGGCSTKTVCSCTAAGTFACQTDPMDACYCACAGGCGGPKGGSGGAPPQGGSGGAPKGGSGGAPPQGGSGGAPPVDCPPPGSSCIPTLECAKSGTVTICDGGVAWQGLDTGAKSDDACAPAGTWELTYGDVALPSGFCSLPAKPSTLVVKKAPSGKLLATFGEKGSAVSIDAATCTMKASRSGTATNPSESWTESTSTTLVVSGDTAMGTYTLANAGFCNGMVSGPLGAARK